MDEVEVDVDQPVGRPRARPRSCRTSSSASQLLLRPAATTARSSRRLFAIVLEVVREVGVEGDGVALGERVAPRRRRPGSAAPASTTAVSRRPARASAGRRARRWRHPGSSGCSETSARWPGSGGVSSSTRWPAAACASGPRRARTTTTWRVLVEAQQLGEAQLEPGGDPAGDGERRAGLAALDLGEHRRADAAALGEVAQREAHRVAQRPDPGPDGSVLGRDARSRGCTLSRTDVCCTIGPGVSSVDGSAQSRSSAPSWSSRAFSAQLLGHMTRGLAALPASQFRRRGHPRNPGRASRSSGDSCCWRASGPSFPPGACGGSRAAYRSPAWAH